MDEEELVDVAREATDAAYAPYSEYCVGAALETADGTVYSGCNVENANYSNSLHAEELALGKATEAGHRGFVRIAISSDRRDGATPCGMCRQSLSEFCATDLRVICDDGEAFERYTLGELLPAAFGGGNLQ